MYNHLNSKKHLFWLIILLLNILDLYMMFFVQFQTISLNHNQCIHHYPKYQLILLIIDQIGNFVFHNCSFDHEWVSSNNTFRTPILFWWCSYFCALLSLCTFLINTGCFLHNHWLSSKTTISSTICIRWSWCFSWFLTSWARLSSSWDLHASKWLCSHCTWRTIIRTRISIYFGLLLSHRTFLIYT